MKLVGDGAGELGEIRIVVLIYSGINSFYLSSGPRDRSRGCRKGAVGFTLCVEPRLRGVIGETGFVPCLRFEPTFDKLLSLGGGSEEISQICVVCLGSLMKPTEVQQQAVQAGKSLIVGEENFDRPL